MDLEGVCILGDLFHMHYICVFKHECHVLLVSLVNVSLNTSSFNFKRDGNDTDYLAAKELLQEFVKQAKARARYIFSLFTA